MLGSLYARPGKALNPFPRDAEGRAGMAPAAVRPSPAGAPPAREAATRTEADDMYWRKSSHSFSNGNCVEAGQDRDRWPCVTASSRSPRC